MNPNEIMEGNKLIAEFMEGEVQNESMIYFKYWQDDHRYFKLADLKYHTSWNWLMPVIEKISRIKIDWEDREYNDTFFPRTFGMLSPEGNPMVRINANSVHEGGTLIEATWLAVVDFIKNNGIEDAKP